MTVVLGVDVGGTFADIVVDAFSDGRIDVWKKPATPGDPVSGILSGLGRSGNHRCAGHRHRCAVQDLRRGRA